MANYLTHESFQKTTKSQHSKELNLDFDSDFGRELKKDFATEFRKAHKSGDVQLLIALSGVLIGKAEENNQPEFIRLATKLRLACESFDVEGIDYLAKLFYKGSDVSS